MNTQVLVEEFLIWVDLSGPLFSVWVCFTIYFRFFNESNITESDKSEAISKMHKLNIIYKWNFCDDSEIKIKERYEFCDMRMNKSMKYVDLKNIFILDAKIEIV